MQKTIFLLISCIIIHSVMSQEIDHADKEKGFNFIETKIYFIVLIPMKPLQN
jgi:hypothetical protein